MRHLFFSGLFILTALTAAAQTTDTTPSASNWQYVRIQRSSVSSASISRLVRFDDLFIDNRNHWPTGQAGGFTYEISRGMYSMRRVGKQDGKSGRTFINLPDSLDLNRAGTFVIEVELVTPGGGAPEGGLMLGVRDEANYNLFVLRNRTQFMLKRVDNGAASATYLPGVYKPVGKAVFVNAERNTLRIEKHDGKLFFAINGQDIPGGPTTFRTFKGNGIGFISSADAVTFQNLHITVGLP